MLKINNLHVKLEEEDKQILKGVDLEVKAGEVHAVMGPNGSGKSTLSYVLAGRDGYEVTEGTATLDGVDLLALEPEERAAAGLFLAFQYPVEIPGRRQHDLPAHGGERAAQGARRGRDQRRRFPAADPREGQGAEHRRRDAEAPGQCRFFRRREEAQRDPADGGAAAADVHPRRDRQRARRRCDEAGGRGGERAAQRRIGPSWSSPTISGCSITSHRTWCISWPMAASCRAAGRNWRWRSRPTAMPTS